MGKIDGLVILESSGRPIIQSHFTHPHPSYPQIHVDALNDAIARAVGAFASDNIAAATDTAPVTTSITLPPAHSLAATAGSSGVAALAAVKGKVASGAGLDIPPVIWVNGPEEGAALCHVEEGGLRFLAPVGKDVDPLLPLSFLHAFIAVLRHYFGEVSEAAVRGNFDVVYQLLEEMLDDGQPMTTEANALRDVVIPPSFFTKALNAAGVGGLATLTAPPLISPIPWRKPGLRYANNEIYFDIEESIEGIIGRNGAPVALDVWGTIRCNCRLSGTPDLSLHFANPGLMEDVSFHPCVRHKKWTQSKTLSFVPPDGHFDLATFRVGGPQTVGSGAIAAGKPGALGGWDKSMPVTLRTKVELGSRGGSFSFSLHPRLSSSYALEGVVVSFYLGESAVSVDATLSGGPLAGGAGGAAAQRGNGSSSFMFEPATRTLKWAVPKLSNADQLPSLSGTFTTSQKTPRPSPSATLSFRVPLMSLAGLKVDALKVSNESYSPYKGVRSAVVGQVEVRI